MAKTIALLRGVAVAACLLLASVHLVAQNSFRVSGKIRDGNGQPLESVTVSEKGTTNSTVTAADGSFQINVSSGNATLVISSVGFETFEHPVNNNAQANVSLTRADNSMESVVVVGYGTQKKSDVTGALSSISAKTIQERPVTNALQAIQGKAAGVHVNSNIKPGETPVVIIRGNRSVQASNAPLYVVDGIPIVAILGVTSFSINDLNPNDIQSIEILKDASATAIYGSRGANGVILITTKKGTKGKIAVNYNGTVSLDSYKQLTDFLDAGEYIDQWRLALMNGRAYQPTTNTNLNNPPTIGYPDPFLDRDKMGIGTDPYALKSVWMGYEWDVYGTTVKMRPTTAAEQAMGWPAMVPVYNSRNIRNFDWADAAVRTGVTQNHQVSLSTGSDVSRLYLSLGYNKQLGVQRDQDFQRFTININGDISANKWLTLGTSIMAALSEQSFGINANNGNTGTKDLYGRALEQYPWAQPIDDNGFYIKNPGGNLSLWNPLGDIDQALNDRRTSSIMTNVFAEVRFTPWLKYRGNFGAQLRNFRNGAWTGPDATSHLTNRPNTAGYTREENFSWVMENLLYINKSFGTAHTLGITLLQSAQKSRRENIATSVAGSTIPASLWYDLASNTVGNPSSYGSGYTENQLTSYMARVNYTLFDKYLVTASGRYDGSSVLAPDHKWAFFPSFAVAWKLHEEGFMKGIGWLNELKPRIGYGVTGNSSVQPYTTSGPLSRNPYIFGSTVAIGYLPQLVGNPELGWEKTAQLNLGLDFSILNRRVTGSFELYESKTSDLILVRSIPAISGYVQKFENIGKTQNRGIEITLNTINIQKKDFTWSTEFVFGANKEEYTELLNGKQDILADRRFIGQPLSVYFHYDNLGVWTNSKEDMDLMAKFNAAPGNHRFYPGMIKVKDQNGDFRINGDDYVVRGSNRPKWSGGITNTFTYKNFSLSSFIYARIGQTYFGGYPGVFGRVEKDVWSFTNTTARWPMPILGATVDNFTPAMQFHDGSFVVVRNISLTYQMPSKLLKRASIKNLEFNVQVLNPFIWGGDVVKWGLNPDDDTNWDGPASLPNSNNTAPLGGTNNNTIMPQSIVFGVRLGL
jgi:TonB-dependent starch-binding outer membrane protein SusC